METGSAAETGWGDLGNDGASMVREGDELTQRIIACAIEVHRHLGPGLLESVYEGALCVELSEAGLGFARQSSLPVLYKGHPVGDLRLDLLVAGSVIVEVKSVERLDPVFGAQVLSYMRLSGMHVGLLINFNSRLLKDGIRRFVS
jgi:GxxExxY protein